MMVAAAKALGANSPALKDPQAPLLPLLTDVRDVAVEIAVAVGAEAQKAGVAPKTSPEELRAKVIATQWTPEPTTPRSAGGTLGAEPRSAEAAGWRTVSRRRGRARSARRRRRRR